MFANAQVVQANLKRIGITLRVESVDYNLWIQRWQKKDFEATLPLPVGSLYKYRLDGGEAFPDPCSRF